jgi:PAS domain S-box-containing protein
MVYSPRARAICGFPPDGPVTYEMVVAVTHPDDFPYTSAQAARALDPEIRDRSPYEYRIVRPNGEVRWVTAFGEAVFERSPDGTEAATRYVGTLTDITDRRLTEQAVIASERRLQLAVRAGRMAAWQVDPEGRMLASPEMNALLGLPPDATPTIAELEPNYLPGELDRIRAAAATARQRGERHFEIEYRYRRPDGEVRSFNARAEALVGPDGSPDGLIGVAMDVTERKADEERLQFLAREVDHRANNLLSIVQGAIALSQAETVEELREVITGRVHALARAHQLLSDARWSGADLRRLIDEEMAPFCLGRGERVSIAGPAVELAPVAAQSLAMVVHELATNATKHGALSCEGGRVAVSWTISPAQRLRLTWTERGGPRVSPPERIGFGSSVIGRALHGALGGGTRLDWRPEGLVCEVDLPLVRPASP